MNELIKSTDYNRLADLIEQGARIPVGKVSQGVDFWFGCTEFEAEEDGYQYRANDGEDYRGVSVTRSDKASARAEFIKKCEQYKLFFIDPASQQKPPAELAAGEMLEIHEHTCELCMLFGTKSLKQQGYDEQTIPKIKEKECQACEIGNLIKKAKGLKS